VAVGTADAGKPAARVAAVQVSFNDFLDDRPQEAVALLKTSLILGQEMVEVMKQHPVEDCPLRMTRAIYSRQAFDLDLPSQEVNEPALGLIIFSSPRGGGGWRRGGSSRQPPEADLLSWPTRGGVILNLEGSLSQRSQKSNFLYFYI
jgi:hypothetical protein